MFPLIFSYTFINTIVFFIFFYYYYCIRCVGHTGDTIKFHYTFNNTIVFFFSICKLNVSRNLFLCKFINFKINQYISLTGATANLFLLYLIFFLMLLFKKFKINKFIHKLVLLTYEI